MEKRLHGAYGALTGIEAVGLAQAGVTSPLQAIEGRRGLLNAITATPSPESIVRDLGREYLAAGTGIKRHCCCGGQHTTLDGVSELVTRHGFGPEQIDRIRVRLNPREYDAVAMIQRPEDVISAQFSVAFGIGLRLVNGSNGFRDYVDARLDDERILALADKVVCERTAPDALIAGDGPSEVEVALIDGTVHRIHVSHPRGSSDSPLTEEEIIAKFDDLAGDVLGEAGTARVLGLVRDLISLPDVGVLADAIVARNGYEVRPLERLTAAAR